VVLETQASNLDMAPSTPGHTNKSTSYRPEIDGLRAIAVVAVIINHIDKHLLSSGFLGVDIFFTISGYVITRSLMGSRTMSLPSFLSRFYARRIKRLLPALLVCVLATLLVSSFFIPPDSVEMMANTRMGVASIFGVNNLYLLKLSADYFAAPTQLLPLLHTWSLGVEEQFYFVFPILLWLIGVGRNVPSGTVQQRALFSLSALSAGSLLLYFSLANAGQASAYYFTPARFWEIGLGAIACLAMGRLLPQLLPKSSFRVRRRLAPLSLLLMGVLFFAPTTAATGATLAAVLLTCCFLVTAHPGDYAHRLLTHKLLLFTGTISYSLYLWHFPILSISRWTIGIEPWTIPFQVTLMLVLAWSSYHWIEQPFRHRQGSENAAAVIRSGVLATIAASAMALVIGAYPGNYLGDKEADRRQTQRRSIQGSNISPANCSWENGIGPSLDVAKRNCSLVHPANQAARSMIVLGDSHAWNWANLSAAMHRLEKFDISLWYVPAVPTPPLGWPLQWDRGEDRSVPRQNELLNLALTQLKEGDILVLSNYLLDITRGKQGYAGFRSWLKGLDILAERMGKKGAFVVVSLPAPTFNKDPSLNNVMQTACIPQWFRPRVPAGCVLSQPRQELLEEAAPIVAQLKQLQRRHKNLLLFDPFPILCPASEENCTNYRDGLMLYLDNNHLNTAGSEFLVDDFRRFLHSYGLSAAPERARPAGGEP
jgi:peptidoglycan/LPS O-acetylase OafA/YrhL